MKKHMELTDLDFETQFRNTTLDPNMFTHEAHIRLAWIHVRAYGLPQAEANIGKQILNFAQKIGEAEIFHLTLTIAAVRIVAHFTTLSNSNSFSDFIAEFPQLKTDFKSLVRQHYSFDIFSSQLAKKTFLAPDLKPF